MVSSDNHSRGFATIAIIGGTVVAVVVGGVFYFLRSKPVEVDTTLKDDSAAVVGDGSVLSLDAEEALLRSLPRDRSDDYCSLLGLDRDSCADGVDAVCRDLFNNCGIDARSDSPDVLRQLAEACLVLGTEVGRTMYFAWLDSGASTSFPLYYAIFGLTPDSFSQKKLFDAYQVLLDKYFSSASCDNPEILRLLAEGILVLSITEGRAMYDEWLTRTDSSPFPLYYAVFGLRRGTFTQQQLTDIFRQLVGQYFNQYYGNNIEVLRLLVEAYMALRDSPSTVAYDGFLDRSLSANFSAPSLAFDGTTLFSALNDSGLPPSDVGGVLGAFDFSPAELGGILRNLALSPSDVGAILAGLNFSPTDLGSVVNSLNLSPTDMSSLVGDLNLSPGGIGTLLGNTNFSPSSVGTVLTNANLSPPDLSAAVGNLNLSPVDLNTLAGFLPPFPPPGSFSGVVVPSDSDDGDGDGDSDDDGAGLPVVTIAPYPKRGRIGVFGVGQPSFRVSVAKRGSPFASDEPLTVILQCRQSVGADQKTPTLISRVSPTSVTFDAVGALVLTAADGMITMQRQPTVTGSVECAVLADTADEAAYVVGTPSSATVVVVGSSSAVVTPPSGDVPAVSINALESSIDSGAEAVFRVSANRTLFSPLHVRYSCTVSDIAVVGGGSNRHLSEQELTIERGFAEDITISTAHGTSGVIHCSLLDDEVLYTVRNDTDKVSVGLLDAADIASYDPTLPTVSLIAYRTKPNIRSSFSEQVSSAVVGDPNTHFGFVINDPDADYFGEEVEGSRVTIPDNYLYVLSAEYGGTISVVPYSLDGFYIGLVRDTQVPIVLPTPLTSKSRLVEKPAGYDAPAQLRQYPWGNVYGYGESRTIIRTYKNNRVVVQRGTGTNTVCGLDNGTLFCAEYRGRDPASPVIQSLPVTVQCYREFADRRREREVFGALVGGRYAVQDSSQYGVLVDGYVADSNNLRGELYQFIRPTGRYISVAAGSEGEVLPIDDEPGVDLFSEIDSTFSCEIVGGGEEDGYNVGRGYVAVRVQPRPTVSLERRGARRATDDHPDSFGEPVAYVDRRQTAYTLNDGDFADFDPGTTTGGEPGNGGVLSNLGKSFGVGFLTSFGSCVGSSILNSGISALASKLGVGGFGSVPTSNKKLDTKECSLDSAASDAVLEVLTGVARDYITWAHEGFEDKPLFVRNPTTFYKNFHDDVIGRAIDRSGLGFLCDIGVGNLDAYTAKVRINLQQRYFGLATERPRCTYNDLENNLEDFFDDASDALHDFKPEYLKKLGFTIDGVANPRYAGTLTPLPRRSDAGNQLDALSLTLGRAMKKAENSNNILLSIATVDDEVSQAEQEFDTVAKPPGQLFNPNDPTSLAAFRECTDAENPEGDADCFLLNVSGSRITDAVGDGIGAVSERLLHIDEFGEIGQLVKMAVNATSAGLMKKYLKNGFGVTVGRETADLLGDISEDVVTRHSSGQVDLSERWWSAFFDGNQFYNDLLSTEMYAQDVVTLLQYIDSSFHENPTNTQGGGKEVPLPPTNPYTSFYAIHDNQKGCTPAPYVGPCLDGFEHLKDVPQSTLSRHYTFMRDSAGDADGSFEWGWNWKGGSTIEEILESVFPLDANNTRRREGVRRFRDAYRFLSNPIHRQQYNEFLLVMGPADGASAWEFDTLEHPYAHKGGSTWEKVIDPPPLSEECAAGFSDFCTLPVLLQALKKVSVGEFGKKLGAPIIRFPSGFESFKSNVTSLSPGDCSGPLVKRVTTPAKCRFYINKRIPNQGCVGEEILVERDFDNTEECGNPLAANKTACEYTHDRGEDYSPKYKRYPTYQCSPISQSHRHDSTSPNHGTGRNYLTCPVKSKLIPSGGVKWFCPHTGAVSKIGQARRVLIDVQKLRRIYEATLAAHIHLVGSVDEYAGTPLLDSVVHSYRKDVLDGAEHANRFERWEAVRDATYEKFRNGTMEVYIPVDDGEFTADEYANVLLGDCRDKTLGTLKTQEGVYIRSYEKTKCTLGTVFQDQAYFSVRRENADLSEPLTVYLACGYDLSRRVFACADKDTCSFHMTVNEIKRVKVDPNDGVEKPLTADQIQANPNDGVEKTFPCAL